MGRSGSIVNHNTAPNNSRTAATRHEAGHPKRLAMAGGKDDVSAPASWFPIFITPETAPAEAPPRSAVVAQNEDIHSYSAPAPPARTILAPREYCPPTTTTLHTAPT